MTQSSISYEARHVSLPLQASRTACITHPMSMTTESSASCNNKDNVFPHNIPCYIQQRALHKRVSVICIYSHCAWPYGHRRVVCEVRLKQKYCTWGKYCTWIHPIMWPNTCPWVTAHCIRGLFFRDTQGAPLRAETRDVHSEMRLHSVALGRITFSMLYWGQNSQDGDRQCVFLDSSDLMCCSPCVGDGLFISRDQCDAASCLANCIDSL